VGETALCKSLDDIEVALIDLQYAVADYYSSKCNYSDTPFGALDAKLSALRRSASSAQLAIDLLRAMAHVGLIDKLLLGAAS
jgi:hypothetical protein